MRVELTAEIDYGRQFEATSRGPMGCWGRPAVAREAHRSKLDDCLRRRLGGAEASALAERLSDIDPADSAGMAAIAAKLGSA